MDQLPEKKDRPRFIRGEDWPRVVEWLQLLMGWEQTWSEDNDRRVDEISRFLDEYGRE